MPGLHRTHAFDDHPDVAPLLVANGAFHFHKSYTERGGVNYANVTYDTQDGHHAIWNWSEATGWHGVFLPEAAEFHSAPHDHFIFAC